MKKALIMVSISIAMVAINACHEKTKPETIEKKAQPGTPAAPATPREGDECTTAGSYVCSGDTLLTCAKKGKKQIFKVALNCAEDELKCQTNKATNETDCVEPCQKTDEIQILCTIDEETNQEYSNKYVCQENVDGSHSFWQDESATTKCQNNICHNGVGCQKIDAEEGNACDTDYIEKCNNNNVIYCKDNKITAISCGINGDMLEDTSCKIKKDENYAFCVAPCNKLGDLHGTCMNEQEFADYYYEIIGEEFPSSLLNFHFFRNPLECIETEDNQLAFFPLENNLYVSSCTDTSYELLEEDIGTNLNVNDKCNYMLFNKRCDGSKLLYCDLVSATSFKTGVRANDCNCSVLDQKAQCTLGDCADGASDKYQCEIDIDYDDLDREIEIPVSRVYSCKKDDSGNYKYFLNEDISKQCSDKCVSDATSPDFGHCNK